MALDLRMAVKSLRLKNFKCYDNYELNFCDSEGGVFLLFGLFGPNGCGKTTILDAINLVTASFASYEEGRIEVALRRYIRNFKMLSPAGQLASDFLVEADIVSDLGEYTVAVNKGGYVAGKEHPKEIQQTLARQCYRTRYDEELNLFQLRIDRWQIFKELFEAVTGYKVEKEECPMSAFTVNDQELYNSSALLNQYVLSLKITKPEETITDRECSKGEKKIIKNFTTLLNKDDIPSIVIIDDVEMHVEIDRHITLINCIERCFPDSQVIFTTHSPKIVYSFDLERLHDLTVKSPLGNVPWRKSLIRVLGQTVFFHPDDHNREVIVDTLKELRTNPEMDIDWAKSVTREALFTFQGQMIQKAEGI